ncbi:MAG TPA: D-2-hydroxyacid dehydrogenase [Candidatus Eisenbacteria bacterium]|nr:D-2-hydroxyacid dehydrogenase [Candidatus Eisenbacteria bacterium]
MTRVLLVDPHPERMASAVEEFVGESIPWASIEDRSLADIRIWFCAAPPPGKFLSLPSLEWIHTGWAGVEGWMRRPEWREGVTLTRTVGDYPERMSEYVFGYLLAQELGVVRAIREMESRSWKRWTPGSIAGMRLLVVGHGAIGCRIADVGRAFGMNVAAVRRGPVTAADKREGIYAVGDVARLLPVTDVVVNVLPLTRETESFWNGDRFSRMREGSVFVNISRGGTVDEGALHEGVLRGRPGRAILDVFREEPLPPDHPFRGLDEIWVTPHVAGVGTVEALAREFGANWMQWRLGKPLRNAVDRERGY